MIEALAVFVALFAVLFSGLIVGALRASEKEARQTEASQHPASRF